MSQSPDDEPTADFHDGAADRSPMVRQDRGPLERPGDEIGPYRLISQLGEGGFGTVWLAERRHPFAQRVALKIVKAGMDSKSVIARFEQERQALAVMNHPNIAKVIDGGLTPAGRPYFAMEYVKGDPITDFCDARRLGVRERLGLFTQACDAVQHAHVKGLVHRDLKPSNVLAFEADGKFSLKVIDFGVAKALTQRMSEHTIFTETGQMIGTPEYMSPEQADPTASDIDTRSDIYSLGVLLYELVTGALPFEPRELRSKAYGEIQRVIREVDPPTPSARLSTLATKDADSAGRIEKTRGMELRDLAKQLKSELEWIPLKAMRKEPQNRYQSALELRRDIDSYLEGRPIGAGPDTIGYRARKFLRRNKTAVRAVALVAVTLVISLGYRPCAEAYHEWSETKRMNEFDVLAQDPDPAVVTDAETRERIKATGKPWKIRHKASRIVMLLCPPGEFMMGAVEEIREPSGLPPLGDPKHRQHRRVIRKAFYLSRCEVSKLEWRTMVGYATGAFYGDNFPVTDVTWQEVKHEFIKASRGSFRLPSEAEWEYACRAGTRTAYSFGEKITREQVCFHSDRPVLCGSLPPNPWGFNEMHGNVQEWVEDAFLDYPRVGGQEAAEGDDRCLRVLRGGRFTSDLKEQPLSDLWDINELLAATRVWSGARETDSSTGFRVARDPD